MDISLYKENLKKELESYTYYSYGHTSNIYKKDDKIIKEIYLDEELEKSLKMNELLVNIFVTQDKVLSKITVPFISYDTYDKILLLKYPYLGKNLEDTLLNYTTLDLEVIYNNIIKAISLLEKKIRHRDLHIGNIFVNPEDLSVRIGDWGRSLIEPDIKQNDLKYFKETFWTSLRLTYLKKKYSEKELNEMIDKKELQYLVKKEMKYLKQYMKHKPVEFLDKLYKNIYQRFRNVLLKRTSLYKSNSYLPEEVKFFYETYK